jgi:predicted N-formylglutamate amidohydrolase
MKAFLTCEHAGYDIPVWLNKHFHVPEEVLVSHQGWDPGAYVIAKALKKRLGVPLWSVHTSRLLVEANRSQGHKQFFSAYSKGLDEALKARAINYIYMPFRRAVNQWIHEHLTLGPLIHLSIHSFTPILGKEKRKADIGLLYDPRYPLEVELCHQLYLELKDRSWHVRKNYPYQGKSDGHTKQLRKKWAAYGYAGIEIEVNQGLFFEGKQPQEALIKDLTQSFRAVLGYRK